MERLPNLTYLSGTTADLPPGSQFDLLAMHNVTEHLMEIESDFAEFASLIRPGGRIAFRHPNFYAWGGHHMRPRNLKEIVPGDPEQAKYMDWAHLEPRPNWPAKIAKRQNRIRLTALQQLTERHFDIEIWDPRPTLPDEGASRWNDAVLERHPGFSRHELLTQAVVCVARKPIS